MAMFERILVPLDGSSQAELILGQIGKILRREDSEVLLLRVVDLPLALKGMEPAMQVDTDRLRSQQRATCGESFRSFRTRFRRTRASS